jgi:ABC-2 type transport system permease protein
VNLRIISALVSKDISLFSRNRFFAPVTILGLVVYLIIYFVMPRSVDESLDIGVYAPVIPPVFTQVQEEGLKIEVAESEEALKEAVTDGQYVAGIVLPGDIMEKLMSGQKARIHVYFASDVPQEIKDTLKVVVRELAFQQTGRALDIEVSEVVLGPDMIGKQIPQRDRLRPLFAILLVMVETLGLANLLSEEIERRTIHALLVTPVTVKNLFTAKGITGVGLAFIQAVLFMAIVGGMNRQPLIILVTLLLGAVLVTAVSFIIAALGKDMMSVMAWGIIILVILFIPSVGVIFPGSVTDWVKVIPSYYLVDTVHRASNFGSGWNAIWHNLLILVGFNIALIWIGIIALKRKTQ